MLTKHTSFSSILLTLTKSKFGIAGTKEVIFFSKQFCWLHISYKPVYVIEKKAFFRSYKSDKKGKISKTVIIR